MKLQMTRWLIRTWSRYGKTFTSTCVAGGLAFCALCANGQPVIDIGPGWVDITTDGTTVYATGDVTYSSTDASQVFKEAIAGLLDPAYPTSPLKSGGTISVGPGTYVFTKTVGITNRYIRIEGVGDNTLIDTRVPTGADGAAFNMRSNDLEIRNLRITGEYSSSNATSPTLIVTKNKDAGILDLSIDNVTFDIIPEGHAMFVSTDGYNTVNRVIIQNCRFNLGRTYDVPVGDPAGANNLVKIGQKARNVWVRNNLMIGDPTLTVVGIGVWQCNDNIRIYDNTIVDTRLGVAVAKSENSAYVGDPRFIYIERNVIDNSFRDSVWLSGGRDIIVNDNCSKNAGRHGILVAKREINGEWDWPRNVMISNNRIWNYASSHMIWVTALAQSEVTLIDNVQANCP